MCARIVYKRQVFKPGDRVPVEIDGCTGELVWGDGYNPPFARKESLDSRWFRKGWQSCHILADGFAERSRATGELVWGRADGKLYGLHRAGTVVVVTREATPAELHRYGHNRHPIIVKEAYKCHSG